MYGHVSLLCLCLLFVSSSFQERHEDLPTVEETWNIVLKEEASDDEEQQAMICISRLEETEQKLNITLIEHNTKIETLLAENYRLKQELEDTSNRFKFYIETIDKYMTIIDGSKNNPNQNDKNSCNLELTNQIKDLTKNVQDLNVKIVNQETKNIPQNILKEFLNEKNLESITNVISEKLKQDFSKINSNILQSSDTKSALLQEILDGTKEIRQKSENLMQEIISSNKKVDAVFANMTQEQESKAIMAQNSKNSSAAYCSTVAASWDLDKLGDKFYYFSKNIKRKWHDAQKSCRSKGLQLVSIENAEENQLIFDFKTMYGMHWTWIGGTDEDVEGTWKWIGTGEKVSYSNWDRNQPDGRRNYNCMQMWHHGKWDDFSCSSLQSFICELEM